VCLVTSTFKGLELLPNSGISKLCFWEVQSVNVLNFKCTSELVFNMGHWEFWGKKSMEVIYCEIQHVTTSRMNLWIWGINKISEERFFLDKGYKTISGLHIQRCKQPIITKSRITKKHEKARVFNIEEDTKANNIDASTHYLRSLKQSSLISWMNCHKWKVADQ